MELRTFVIHHGGGFVGNDDEVFYTGGMVQVFENVVRDNFTLTDLEGLVERLGYVASACRIRMKVPGHVLKNGTIRVNDPRDIRIMFKVHREGQNIALYIQHLLPKGDATCSLHSPHDSVQSQLNESAKGELKEVKKVVIESDNEDSESEFEMAEFVEDLEKGDVGAVEASKPMIVFGDPDADEFNASDNDDQIQLREDNISNSEDFRSLSEEEDSDGSSRWPRFQKERDMKKPTLALGLRFSSASEFRVALITDSVLNNYDFTFVKNEGHRIGVICKRKCGFKVYASYDKIRTSFQIKTLVYIHKCTKTYTNSHVSAAWLASRYLDEIRDNPNWELKAFQLKIRRDYSLNCSIHQVYRARREALYIIEGETKKQYERLWDYCDILLARNPGSTIKLSVNRRIPIGPAYFHRLFICFYAQSEGFIRGCRPFIGLDGCFLKSTEQGMLLSAVGRDANNQMYPLAIAMVEGECKDSWKWFLEMLMDALTRDSLLSWTFMSDRQKGLVEAFKEVGSKIDHRFCMRHLYANFRKAYPDPRLKDLIWKAASVGTREEFRREMSYIGEIDESAVKYLEELDVTCWARYTFNTNIKSDCLTNNISEAWNKFILREREMPIRTMLETIKKKVMSRIQTKRIKMEKYEGVVCSKIMQKINCLQDKVRWCTVTYAGEMEFSVEVFGRSFIVELDKKMCTCMLWVLSGLPCVHALACIQENNGSVVDYVHSYYYKVNYMKAYGGMIHPIPDELYWPESGKEIVLAPPFKKQPGRPKKARKKDVHEATDTKMKRKSYVKCKNCGEKGHNRKSCRGIPLPVINNEGRVGRSRGGRPPTHGRFKGERKKPRTSLNEGANREGECSNSMHANDTSNTNVVQTQESNLDTRGIGLAGTSGRGGGRVGSTRRAPKERALDEILRTC